MVFFRFFEKAWHGSRAVRENGFSQARLVIAFQNGKRGGTVDGEVSSGFFDLSADLDVLSRRVRPDGLFVLFLIQQHLHPLHGFSHQRVNENLAPPKGVGSR